MRKLEEQIIFCSDLYMIQNDCRHKLQGNNIELDVECKWTAYPVRIGVTLCIPTYQTKGSSKILHFARQNVFSSSFSTKRRTATETNAGLKEISSY